MSDSKKKENLLLLFDRPTEPAFMTKGDKKAVFDIPQDFLIDKYKPAGTEIVSRFGKDAGESIPVKEIALPDLGDVLLVKRDENFSLFMPLHRKCAGRLIDLFLGVRNVEDLTALAVYARDRVNPYLFNYAFSVALLHRHDTKDLDLPSVVHSFPDKYVDSKVFAKAREDATIVPEGSRIPIEIPKDYTATDLEEEHRLAYFREDLGVNLHHWHWHLVYPFEAAREIVNKNRRGELFYYMHQQIIARYNIERFCNHLKRVERFIDFRAPIPEAYFPKLDSTVASRAWPARVANQTLRNLKRDADKLIFDIDDLERWRDRIFEAINSGRVKTPSGQDIILNETEGIDIMGNLIESTVLSPNQAYYGDLHNMGHVFFSYIHDPDHRHLESFGVIGDNATAMRDPIFYRWHSYIDDIFQKYKETLPQYTVNQLDFAGVTVDDIKIQSGPNNNVIQTFWQQSDVDLSRGMDFQPRGKVFVRFTHLNHFDFTYNISVTSDGAKEGTCRIFLGPKFDEKGKPWMFREQRRFFIELDKFKVNLKQGQNTIVRQSTQSSVTIPFERSFRDLDQNRPTDAQGLAAFNFCGCGWPAHMLVPKGTPEGFPCHLFVMISNYADDKIEQNTDGACNDAGSYCGIRDKLYPDRRAMGYPFDREARSGVDHLQEFITPNMRVQEVSVKFLNKTFKPRKKN